MVSFGCRLPVSNSNSGSDPSNPDTKIDMEQFIEDNNVPLVRTDRSTFKKEKFLSRSFPVEVSFSGEETADVVLKGALAQPNMEISDTPPEKLDLIFVLKKDLPNTFSQDGDFIFKNYWRVTGTVDMLDANGDVISTSDLKANSLDANIAQVFHVYFNEIPESVASVNVTTVLEPGKIGVCAPTSSDLDFQVPNSIASHTPVRIKLTMGDWNEAYAKKGVLGLFNLRYKNPFDLDFDINSTLLSLDDEGSLVGYMETPVVMPPNDIYDRIDDWQSTLFSDIPTQVVIYDKWVNFCDVVKESR
jgi:hypothetical protein